jgi:ferrous iron transport protein A
LQLAGRSGTEIIVTDSLTLDLLAPAARAQITAIAWDTLDPDEGKRLRALGIDAGARVAIAHRGIFFGRDPIALIVGRTTVALRRAHARAMTVVLV